MRIRLRLRIRYTSVLCNLLISAWFQLLFRIQDALSLILIPNHDIFIPDLGPHDQKFTTLKPGSRVVEQDPNWIRIQSGQWILIQEGKNDPQT
jgi:hypothetical protein